MPAWIAANTKSSSSYIVKTRTAMCGLVCTIWRVGLDAVYIRHREIHEDNVRLQSAQPSRMASLPPEATPTS